MKIQLLESLSKLIMPPPAPVENGNSSDWGDVEKLLGVKLPDDYKLFINIYGTCRIGGFLYPFNPFSGNKYLNLMMQIKVKLDANRTMIEKYGAEEGPYPFYPEPSGLLPWGGTDNGDVLYWLMKGDPDGWAVVIHAPRDGEYELHQETMTSVLEKLIRGDIVSKIFPGDFPDKDNIFASIENNGGDV